MKQLLACCLCFLVCLSLQASPKDRIDRMFVTDSTLYTDITNTFFGGRFGSPQSEMLSKVKASEDTQLQQAIYGEIQLGITVYNEIVFQQATLQFHQNRFSNILFGSSFLGYEDALRVYLRIKRVLARQYGESLFKQKKQDMTNVYDLKGQNMCILQLNRQEDKQAKVTFHVILSYWNKALTN